MDNDNVRSTTKLTLGPVLYNWRADAWRDFYFRIADEADIDTVCVGEVVCSKRLPFFEPHLPEVVERLSVAGKEVILSSLALVMSERELAQAFELADMAGFLVEANDVSVISRLAGRAFSVGPFINVYNEGTLGYLESLGAVRICLPAEIGREGLVPLAAAAKGKLEVQVFGRLPLAISARCYAARAHNLTKDGCRYVCADDPDGMTVETLDGASFLSVNGTQTLSYRSVNLLAELSRLQEFGIRRFRLSPQSIDMVAVAKLFRMTADGILDASEANSQLACICPTMLFSNGYFYGEPGHAFVGGAGGA